MDNKCIEYKYFYNSDEFYEIENIIRDDCKRILLFLDKYPASNSKEYLEIEINNVIDNICFNKFDENKSVLYDLFIKITDDYLIFSYYTIADDKICSLKPNLVAISRNMKKYLFITGQYDDEFIETDMDDISYYDISENGIAMFTGEKDDDDRTNINHVFADRDVNKYINSAIGQTCCCKNCDWCITSTEEDEIIDEQGYFYDNSKRPHAGDCALNINHNGNYYCDNFYNEDASLASSVKVKTK